VVCNRVPPTVDALPGKVPGPAGPAGGEAAGPAADVDPFDMAISVTRHVEITGPASWRHLASGFDGCDLSFWVEWGVGWPEFTETLERARQVAAAGDPLSVPEIDHGRCLVWGAGRRPFYAFHLQYPECHVFLGRGRFAGAHPNVQVSVNARALWLRGPRECVSVAESIIHRLKGFIQRVCVSRCDLAADFHVPGGLSFDYLRECLVTQANSLRPFIKDGRLQTLYVGAKSAPVQLRIYDKSAEIESRGEKTWLCEVYGTDEREDVWRVEFQLRRDFLRSMGVNGLSDLAREAGGLWRYLTDKWCSLRLPDDGNTSRRAVCGFWLAVQALAEDFGGSLRVQRLRRESQPETPERFIRRTWKGLAAYAARFGIADVDDALSHLTDHVRAAGTRAEFDRLYHGARIRLGHNDADGTHASF